MRMNDDLISRQGVFDVLNGIKIPRNATWYQYYRQALDEVGCLPTISKVRTADDCISRQAALDCVTYDVEYTTECIKQLPSAQPERKTGRWLDAVIPNDNGGLPVQVCDQCNTFFPLAYTGGGHRFCPNCGAKMEVTE